MSFNIQGIRSGYGQQVSGINNGNVRESSILGGIATLIGLAVIALVELVCVGNDGEETMDQSSGGQEKSYMTSTSNFTCGNVEETPGEETRGEESIAASTIGETIERTAEESSATNPDEPCPQKLPQIKNPLLSEDFNSFNSVNWHKANWANGDPFANVWQPDNVLFNNGIMSLQLDNNGCPNSCSGKLYASGEYRSNAKYGYGLLEARFKPVSLNGTAGGNIFFCADTYNGDPHDEIDIEILGKNTRQIQFNYFTNGAGGHETVVNLPFDAAEDYHEYAILWKPEPEAAICWYVDRELAHSEDGSRGALPFTPGMIMMNYWPGTDEINGWLGDFVYPGTPTQAKYDWVRYSTLDELADPLTTMQVSQKTKLNFTYDSTSVHAVSLGYRK